LADVTWPFATGDRDFAPEGFDEAVEFNVELTTARSGRVTTLSLPGARWRCTLQFPATTVARLVQRRQLEAFWASLRGGADRLLLHNLLTPEPLGTMRGTVTLAASVAAGASTAQITGGSAAPNLLTGGGFEFDSNSDNLANGWTFYYSGAVTGQVPDGLVTGNASPLAQRVYAASLGSTSADQLGIRYTANIPATAGVSYAWAADVRSTTGGGAVVRLVIVFLSAGLAELGSSGADTPAQTTWARRSVVGVAPPSTAFARVYVWIQGDPVGSPIALEVDNAQFEPGTAPTAYAGGATLLRGDRIAFGGQRVMLTADATADDAGGVTVSFQPAHRAGASSGSAVTLVKPTTKYVVTQPVVQMPARGTDLPGFAVELVEE